MRVFALLLGSVLCDVVGQVCFKVGVLGDPGAPERDAIASLGGLLRSPWIAAGIAVYAIEFVLWFAALTLAPLNVAFSVAALSYCGVVLASRYVLHERVSSRRWLGTAAVAAGVVLVCWPSS
jgi:undecaprenyl phosphate-alpha-L-ara4N flippase subunit ArnE